MGYLRDQFKTRRGRRRIAVILGLVLLIWIPVQCSDDRLKPPALIYLPAGTANDILLALQQQGLPISSEEIDTYLHAKTIAPGWIRFNPFLKLDRDAFFRRLLEPKREPTRRVVMYSGETINFFAQSLAKQTLLPEGKLLTAYYHHSPYSDGGILAGYYDIPYQTIPDATMYALVAQSERQFRTLSKRYGHPYDPATFKRTLIIASLIQKETWHDAEMPLIASVITNRLKRNMKLQLDATLNYGPYSHTPVTPKRIRTDSTHYNTYRYPGLPPEPIGSVTPEAIEAALAPTKTDYLYFVRNPQGWHDFSRTYAEHLEKIRRYRD